MTEDTTHTDRNRYRQMMTENAPRPDGDGTAMPNGQDAPPAEDTTHTDRNRYRQMMADSAPPPAETQPRPNGQAAPTVEDTAHADKDRFHQMTAEDAPQPAGEQPKPNGQAAPALSVEDATNADRDRFRQMMAEGAPKPADTAPPMQNGQADGATSIEEFVLEDPDEQMRGRPGPGRQRKRDDGFTNPTPAATPKLSFDGVKKPKPKPAPADNASVVEQVSKAQSAGASAQPKAAPMQPEPAATPVEPTPAAPPPAPEAPPQQQPAAQAAAAAVPPRTTTKPISLDDDLFEEIPEDELDMAPQSKAKKETKPKWTMGPRRPTRKKADKAAKLAAAEAPKPDTEDIAEARADAQAAAQNQKKAESVEPAPEPAPQPAARAKAEKAKPKKQPKAKKPAEPVDEPVSDLRADAAAGMDLRQLDRDLGLEPQRDSQLSRTVEKKYAPRPKRKTPFVIQQIPGVVFGLGLGAVGGYFAGIGLTQIADLVPAFAASGHLVAAFLGACVAVLGAFRASQLYMRAANRRIEAERRLEEKRRADAAERDESRWHREMLGVAGALKYELIQIEGNARLSVAMGTAILPHRPQGLTRDETLRIFRPPQINAFERLSEKITFLPLEVADAVYGAYSRAQQRLFILALIEQEPQTHRSPDATKTMIKEFQALQKSAMDALRRLHDTYTPEEPLKLIHEDFNEDGTQKKPGDPPKQASQ